MVVCSIVTKQVEYIDLRQLPSETWSRSRSVRIASEHNHRKKKRKSAVRRDQSLITRPPFIYFASSYINPYRRLTPIPINFHRRIPSKSNRSRQIKSGIERQRSKSPIVNDDPVDLWPIDSNAFSIEIMRQHQLAINDVSLREQITSWKIDSLDQLIVSISKLVSHRNLVTRVWTIFYWIYQHIEYDIDHDAIMQNESFDPEKIVLDRKANAQGYATLFQTLCTRLAIECVKIFGYVKDQLYRIDQSILPPSNHYWNAVELDSKHWYLIDPTWASGHLNEKQQYIKETRLFYFLSRPECFIYDHFPNDSQWQLLTKPISQSQFMHLPHLNASYFTHQLTMISPKFSCITSFDKRKSQVEILVQAPDDIRLAASIDHHDSSSCLTQYDATRHLWQCLFSPNQSGFQKLSIFVKRPLASNMFIKAIDLGTKISSLDIQNNKQYPCTYGSFLDHRCQIISPLGGILTSGSQVIFNCRIPDARFVRLIVDDQWSEDIPLIDRVFKKKMKVPKNHIIIAARFHDSNVNDAYESLIRYSVAN